MTRSQIDKDTVGGGITELTTDVVAGPGTGSQVATIANDAVTYAKMQNANANTVIARAAATNGDLGEVALAASELVGRGSAGNVAPIALGTNLSMSGNTLNASSSGGITELTTDVVAGPGSGTQVATIANDAVTYAKMQNASANTVIARAAATGGDIGEVAIAASQLVGRGSTGDIAPIVLGTNLSMSGTTLNATGGGGITSSSIPSDDNSFARYDGTSGTVIQDGGPFATLDDGGNAIFYSVGSNGGDDITGSSGVLLNNAFYDSIFINANTTMGTVVGNNFDTGFNGAGGAILTTNQFGLANVRVYTYTSGGSTNTLHGILNQIGNCNVTGTVTAYKAENKMGGVGYSVNKFAYLLCEGPGSFAGTVSEQYGIHFPAGSLAGATLSRGIRVEDAVENKFAGSMSHGITTVTTTTTLNHTHYTVLVDATGGAVTINLPTAASAPGRVYNIKKIDSSGNAVTIDASGAELIDGAATKSTTTQYVTNTIQSDGTARYII